MKKIILLVLCSLCAATLWASNEDYIKKYKDVAIREMHAYGIPSSITLAQGILESAAGTSRLAVKANNHFGIKCHNDWKGEGIYHDDDKKDECFRTYKDAEESFTDHSLFIKNRARYSFLFELDKTDYKGWAKGLKQAGYATDPNYAKRLIDLIERYDLHQYDRVVPYQEVKNVVKPALSDAGIKYVTVNKGESYYTIGKKYKIPFDLIYSYNDVDRKSRQVEEGSIVYLKAKKSKNASVERYHTVQKGESMHDISQKYGIKIHKLYDMNNKPYTEAAQVGEKLKLK